MAKKAIAPKLKEKALPFEKVGECLYRNPASGTYFALLKKSGKQIKASLETKDLPEARRKLRAFRADMENRDTSNRKFSLVQLTHTFEKTFQHQAKKTIANKTRVLERVRKEWHGGANRPIDKIKSSEVGEFLAKYKGGASYNQALEVLRAMFEMAEDDRLISRSPASKFVGKKRETPIRPTPSVDEFRAIVQSIRSQRFSDSGDESADVVEFWGLAGMGPAESYGLTFGDVNFKKGEFIAFRQKTRAGYVVPIFDQVRPLLESRRKMAIERNGGKNPLPDSRVFSLFDPKKAIATACAALGLPQYSSRAFRRHFITTAIERGVDIPVIALWQGHRDGGRLILSTYAHVRPIHSNTMAKILTAI